MKFVLVITDTKRKNLFFYGDNLKLFSLTGALDVVYKKQIDNAYIVQKKTGAYIRTKYDPMNANNLETFSLSAPRLYGIAQGVAQSTPAMDRYLELYIKTITDAGPYIKPRGSIVKIPTGKVIETVRENSRNIFDAASRFAIDPYIIGAIVIDEFSRLMPFEHIIDGIGVYLLGRNASVGLAQVKLETANNLIRKGIYNPNSKDVLLPFIALNTGARKHLYQYVKDPRHNIFFVGALLRALTDEWLPYIDLSKRPEILSTLYHRSYRKPHAKPESNERGDQIAKEFYVYAKQWLK